MFFLCERCELCLPGSWNTFASATGSEGLAHLPRDDDLWHAELAAVDTRRGRKPRLSSSARLSTASHFFDTANMYLARRQRGDSRASAPRLRSGRDQVVIATKAFFHRATAPTSAVFRASTCCNAIDDSLRRLGTDYVDLTKFIGSIRHAHRGNTFERSTTSSRRARRGTLARRAWPRGSLRQCSRRRPQSSGRGSCRCRTTTTWCTGRTEGEGGPARAALPRPDGPGQAARTPFVLLVVLLLGGGLIGLLRAELRAQRGRRSSSSDLQKETKSLTDEQQALQRDVDAYSAPDALERRARELGMVPGGDPAFLDPDGTVKGVPGAAASDAAHRWRSRPMPLVLAPGVLDRATVPTPTRRPPPRRRRPPHQRPRPRPRRVPHHAAPHDPRQVTEVSDQRNRRAAGCPAPPGPPAPAGRRAPGPRRPPGPPPGARPAPAAPATIRLGSPRPRLRLVSLGLTLVHARLRRTAAPGAGRRRRARTPPRPSRTATSAARWPPSAARSPTATASPWRPAWTRTTSPPTRRCSPARTARSTTRPEQAAALLAPILGKDAAELAKKLRTPKHPLRRCSPAARPRRSGSRSRT